ncbi:helix-turn-helix domain-containing protein [Enterococcus hirae]|uniref:helix-turn-helix domain-containing protein n=1 Tax=Enterococcus hirae TaxID=1354 RepID=UPI00136B852C|nr:helix-turn-helix transcriptional regulator [Enterococcus hirae]NAE18355.1 hypothetical protein [Enterococcus hirae]
MPTAADPTLRDRLRLWRHDQGLTLPELSDLSVSMLSLVKRGQRQLAPMTQVRAARRLEVHLRDLFDVEPVEDEVPA